MDSSSAMPFGGVEAASTRLESGIRQLKCQYDMFFAGALDREPLELRRELEKLIKFYRTAPGMKYHERFRFNALVARFNTFSELWGKVTRSREEGSARGPAARTAPNVREQLLTRCRVADPAGEEPAMRKLYSRFVEARDRVAPGKRQVSYENFVRGVTNQTQRLQKSAGCGEIELRLVLCDEKVQLKARPGQ